jgi:RNA recognition motif-containing protein
MQQLDDQRTLFVGDLSVYCNEQDMHSLFAQFGSVEKITIKRGMSGATNLSYGFVKFFANASAEKAVCLNGSMFMGRAIR